MSSDYDRIRADNIREYGEGTRHLAFLGRLYTDRTHFIFELLQNAEDAKATRIRFVLAESRLEVMHDGRLFDEMDVRGICGVGEGTKAEDLTQIGKFGIGFKSVYAYTLAPEIHSGDEHFRIEHYVRPYATTAKEPGPPWTTLFVFPFDTPDMEAEKVVQEIGKRLCNLNVRTLLFLRNISEIAWAVIDGSSGFYVRQNQKKGLAQQVTVIGQNDEKEEEENWLVFERPVPHPAKSGVIKVEIAFRLVQEEKSNRDTIIKTTESPLVVFFPTEKETRFGFLIQGPYRTTPSRDNIPPEDDWNKTLVQETAKLVVDTLHELEGMGLLSISLLEAMPIRLDDFPEGGMFRPIVDSVRKAFKEETLLPADDGSFVSAGQAKLAEADWLRNLLSEEQLREFYGVDFRWITHNITERKTSDLWKYLKYRLSVEEIDSDKLAAKIRPSFLEKQTDEWIARFYTYLDNVESFWRKDPPGPLRARGFIRLEDGQHVNPFRNDGSPNCYLPPQGETEFPVVKRSIVLDEGAFKFLKALGLTEPDIVAEVIEKILPKYKITEVSNISDREHSQDISKILRALKTDSQHKKERLVQSLRETAFLKATNAATREITYKRPGEIYIRSAGLEIYFKGNPEAWFLSEVEGKDHWMDLGVEDKPRLLPFSPQFSWEEKQKIRENSRCTREISTVDYMFDGLHRFLGTFEEFKDEETLKEGALILWNFLLEHLDHRSSYSKDLFFQGEHKWGYYKGEHWAHFQAAWVKVLRDASWLPAPKNGPVKPGEISLEELPDEFRRDEHLRKYFGMKSNEVAILAEKIGVEVDDIQFVKEYQKEFQDWKKVILQSSSAFPIRRSIDPGRRAGELTEKIRDATKKVYKELLRSVRTTRGTIDPKTWLRNQYTNDRGQVICQICCNEMPFKKRDGEYYFEAVEVVSDKRIEFEELYLALCPVCAAKYQIFVKEEPKEMEKVKRKIIEDECCEVPVSLDAGNEKLRFVEIHFNDLKTILDAKENDK